MDDSRPLAPFSLAQANEIGEAAYCPHCGHKRGDIHPILNKPWCVHQFFAAERLKGERKLAEANVEFKTAEAFSC
jgi:hypothetical protein